MAQPPLGPSLWRMNASILFRILATTAVAWRIAERKPKTAKVAIKK